MEDFADSCIHLTPSEKLLRLPLELSMVAYAHSLSIWKGCHDFQASFSGTKAHLKKPATQPTKKTRKLHSGVCSALLCSSCVAWRALCAGQNHSSNPHLLHVRQWSRMDSWVTEDDSIGQEPGLSFKSLL